MVEIKIQSHEKILTSFCTIPSSLCVPNLLLAPLLHSDEMQTRAMMLSVTPCSDIFRAAQVLNMSPADITAPVSHTNDVNAGTSEMAGT